MATVPDQSLIEALADGRPEAYARLYEQFGGRLLRTARMMFRDATDAEDAVQDLFVELARYRRRYSSTFSTGA